MALRFEPSRIVCECGQGIQMDIKDQVQIQKMENLLIGKVADVTIVCPNCKKQFMEHVTFAKVEGDNEANKGDGHEPLTLAG